MIFIGFRVTQRLAIAFSNPRQHDQKSFAAGTVWLGREPQPKTTAANYAVSVDDAQLAATQCSIEWESNEASPTDSTKVKLTNLGRSIVLGTGPRLHRGQSIEVSLPLQLCLADTHVQLFWQQSASTLDETIATLPSNRNSESSATASETVTPSAGTLTSWLETLSDLQRSVAGSHHFFEQAARATFNPGGLDGGMVLLPAGEQWTVAASHLPYPDAGVGYREDLVRRAAAAKDTLFHDTRLVTDTTKHDLHSAVVSPVLDSDAQVIAMVYGFRSQHRTNSRRGVRTLEAQFVRVIADSISAAMTRMETEALAARSRALMDQAFSPKVARQLENDPSFLDGQSREVTVLFADLFGFSTISERVGPKTTYELLTDVMDCFSQVIADHDGVVIDFFGDGLAAFWNAPIEQPNHPLLACQCGQAIIDSLGELNQRWRKRLQQLLRAGVGIHTGVAQVGNAGSRTRLKYGPQGNTVNLASRIEATTRHVGSPIVISGATAEQVADQFCLRRICNAQLDGIQQPAELFQFSPLAARSYYRDSFEKYAEALTAFEAEDFSTAIVLLTELQTRAEADDVSQFLLTQAIANAEGLMAAVHKMGIEADDFAAIAISKLAKAEA